MFGYITINKAEMKFKEFDIYHSYYCGLCMALKEQYGKRGQLTLSYDMTFVLMLLSSLYEPDTEQSVTKCVAHPFEKHPVRKNDITGYVADMNVLLSFYKCRDDWEDEHKLNKLCYSRLLNGPFSVIRKKYPEKTERIASLLSELTKQEQAGTRDIDRMSGLFGEIMAEIFLYKKDEWQENLFNLGYYLGKFIYLIDAYEDIEKDIKKKNYNPLRHLYNRAEFEDETETILTMMMAECSRNFEQLPIVENTEILRNILYSGVWCRYEAIKEKRNEGQKDE